MSECLYINRFTDTLAANCRKALIDFSWYLTSGYTTNTLPDLKNHSPRIYLWGQRSIVPRVRFNIPGHYTREAQPPKNMKASRGQANLSFLLIVALSSECACFVPEPGQNIHLPLPKTKPSGSIPTPLALASVYRYLTPAVAKTYVVTFRSHNNDRPSKFIVVADNMKSAINMAWEHGGPDFQARFDKFSGQAQEMKEGALRVL